MGLSYLVAVQSDLSSYLLWADMDKPKGTNDWTGYFNGDDNLQNESHVAVVPSVNHHRDMVERFVCPSDPFASLKGLPR